MDGFDNKVDNNTALGGFDDNINECLSFFSGAAGQGSGAVGSGQGALLWRRLRRQCRSTKAEAPAPLVEEVPAAALLATGWTRGQ